VQSAVEVVEDYFRAFAAADTVRLVELFTQDAAVMPNGSRTLRGRDAIEAFFRRAVELARIEFEAVIIERTLELSDTATYTEVWTREAITVFGREGIHHETFREVFLLRRGQDGWLIDSYMGNSLSG
jgi:uncharacterized protein (TIGR02246 family)